MPFGPLPDVLVGCDFTSVLCTTLFNRLEDPGSWVWSTGNTTTPNTGPPFGQGGSGGYVYVEATGRAIGDQAR